MRKRKLFLEIVIKMLIVHKHRSILSILGILSGVAMLLVVNNISNSTMKSTKELLERFGPELIVVEPGKVRVAGYAKSEYVPSNRLSFNDVTSLKNSLVNVKSVAPVVNISGSAIYKNKSTSTTISGITGDIFQMRKLSLMQGRYFTNVEEEVGERKCVLGYSVYKALFGNGSAYGQNIMIFKVFCEIIGVLSPKGKDLAGIDLDNVIYIPINTFKSRLANVESVSAILIEADPNFIDEIKKSIAIILRQNHGISTLSNYSSKNDDFNIFSLRDVANAKTAAIKLVSLLSKLASFITFSIGGLGIFAIMLLSVYERQKEIGIRMAVGAKKRDIIVQFLGESVVIAFIGTLLGLVFGIFIFILFIIFTHLPFTFNILSFFYTIFISLILGLSAGIYPAIIASTYVPLKTIK